NNKASVDIMIRSSQHIAQELVDYGVDFQRDEDGCFVFTREGAHSENRILFHEDLTGREITGKLLERAKERENIRIEEHTTLVDLLCDEKENRCCGALCAMQTAPSVKFVACGCTGNRRTGGLFRFSPISRTFPATRWQLPCATALKSSTSITSRFIRPHCTQPSRDADS
ncbi:FAD-binding protein, partial [Butyricicoccus porcorum]|uniref:FAD-binding protein n=1 Tax=Butyricicoccus porcorum TaxID=1945634 RepID=UPI0038B29BB1